jgi:biopolymer transport protein ExbB
MIWMTRGCVRAAGAVAALLAGAAVFAQDNATAAADSTGGGGVFSWEVLKTSGWIGLLIAALGFLLLTLAIYYSLTLRRPVFLPASLAAEASEALKGGQPARALEICRHDASLLSRALAAALARRADGYDEMVHAAQSVGQEESMRFHQSIGYLALIGTVAPMLGLLGTVYGMIAAFRAVAEQAGYLQPGRLAGGIYTALTTTLLGLMVAIPAMSAYVFFRYRLLDLLGETAVVVEELIYPFKKGRYRETPRPAGTNPPSASAGPEKPAGVR